MNLLLYAPATSSRLAYTCHFIFTELLKLEFSITTDATLFNNFEGIKITYSTGERIPGIFHIGNAGLLFENNIREQAIECFEVNGYKAFYKTPGAGFPFDILSATFYLISRYEEYLPHQKDFYGRYAHENSLAFKENFLHLPLINIWAGKLMESIQQSWPSLQPDQQALRETSFRFLPTYDIDMAWSWLHKGFIRNAGGFLKSPSLERVKVLLDMQKDPFDSYGWLDELHRANNLKPIYFFLVAAKNGIYDKNILPHKKQLRQLIKSHAARYTIGIHPSWQTGDDPSLLAMEKQQLEEIIEKPVTQSRHHYIRFDLPGSYRQLLEAGITDEYSMGYGSINGFRASVAVPFTWFNLQRNEASLLRIHPFCFMDANAYYEQKLSTQQASEELMRYYNTCKVYGGQLISIWHNNFVGTDPKFMGWGDFYKAFIESLNNSNKSRLTG